MENQFTDISIRCIDCARTFIWESGEQKFFAEKGFEQTPKRCPSCRRARRLNRSPQPAPIDRNRAQPPFRTW